MDERELLFQISNIVNGPVSFGQAAEQIARLLERESCALGFFFDCPNGGEEHLGNLTLVFASDQGEFQRRLSEFVREQLSMLAARVRLSERRAQLKREIAQIEEDLATRKLMQRAEGLLVSRRCLTTDLAKRWIAETSRKTGLSKNDVADRIIAYYQATALLEQRIA